MPNASVLIDAHWMDSDPSALDVYGWAAWSPDKAILVLRNPTDHAATCAVDVGRAFELPAGAPTRDSADGPWKEDAARPSIALVAGAPWRIEPKPFEVVTNVTPAR